MLLAVNCFFEQEKSLQLIADYLEPLQNINSELTQLQLDNEAVMKAIEVQNGFLVEYDVNKLLVNCLNSAARN